MYSYNRIIIATIFARNQMYRHMFTSSIKSNISKQTKMLKKLMSNNKFKRDPKETFMFDTVPKKGPSIYTIRRMNVLNQIFMEHITDFMSMGEIDSGLLDKNIEITDVKITPDFKLINVFWLDYSTDTSKTEEILHRCAFQLRHELSQLRVIGIVPPIQFVKCKYGNMQQEVEKRLAIADYGEDYIPSTYPSVEHCVVAPKILNNPDNPFYITLPVMKHNIFGLDHFRIMSKIKASLKQQTYSISKQAIESSNSTPNSEIQNNPEWFTVEKQEEQFSKFLTSQKKQRKQKSKMKLYNRKIDYFNENYLDDINTEQFDNEDDTEYFDNEDDI